MNSSHPQCSALHIKRLGLLGGSFNPIHRGHLTIANLVREQLQLDRVLFIPTGDPPHKRGGSLAPAPERLEMVRLAIAGSPYFEVSDIEVNRTGKSYTIDTVQELQQQYGPSTELFFIIGLDAFLDFPDWKEPRKLLRACRFVVVPRPGHSFRSLARLPLLPNLESHGLDQLDSGNLIRLDIPIPSGPGIICLPLTPCPISSSAIRQAIKGGATLANLLPAPVESYILRHSLYQEDRYRTHI
ncbi:MAG TPA: nicotinate-nucleotide adenylyltransferase [Nitrospira sp.]|nr:nicotinate-nucleotide adenylyltransferase [Nitrospira sp.]